MVLGPPGADGAPGVEAVGAAGAAGPLATKGVLPGTPVPRGIRANPPPGASPPRLGRLRWARRSGWRPWWVRSEQRPHRFRRRGFSRSRSGPPPGEHPAPGMWLPWIWRTCLQRSWHASCRGGCPSRHPAAAGGDAVTRGGGAAPIGPLEGPGRFPIMLPCILMSGREPNATDRWTVSRTMHHDEPSTVRPAEVSWISG